MTRLVVLDNEAVQALMSVDHPKHRRVIAHVQVVGERKKKAVVLDVVAPTTVRAEAGWDRRSPQAAFINLLRIRDSALGTSAANETAAIVAAHGVSVPDAHIGEIVRTWEGPGTITVLSSDPHDMRVVAGTASVTVVQL